MADRCWTSFVRSGLLRRDRLRAAIGADAHVSKKPFRHLDRRRAGATQCPTLDLDGDRAVADVLDRTVTGDLVADADRAVKRHGGDGDRHDAAAGAAHRDRRAGEIHLAQEPTAENIAVRIGVGRHGDGADRRIGIGRHFNGGGSGRRSAWRGPAQFAFSEANFTTLAHLSISSATNCLNCGVVIGADSTPSATRRDLKMASPPAATMAAASFATMSAGVPAGAVMPYQPTAS